MTSIALRWLLTAALALAVAATAVSALFAFGAPLVDQPLITGVDVVSDQGRAIDVGPEAQLVLDRGALIVTLTGAAATALKALDVAVVGGLAIGVLWLLRRFVAEATGDRPFSTAAAGRLRTAGLLLLALPVWQLAAGLMRQALVIDQVEAAGATLVHGFAPAAATGETLRLLPDVNLGLAAAGLVILVIAQAFRAGAELQQDSDEIV